jgi:hypothetical protein
MLHDGSVRSAGLAHLLISGCWDFRSILDSSDYGAPRVDSAILAFSDSACSPIRAV